MPRILDDLDKNGLFIKKRKERKVNRKIPLEKALIFSLLAIILTMSLLVGTTYAWFTDSVTSTNNVIQTGSLDVELYYRLNTANEWKQVKSDTNLFMQNAIWGPGHVELIWLKIVNEGNLAFNYEIGINVTHEVGSFNVDGDEFYLSDYIMYGFIDGESVLSADEALEAVRDSSKTLKIPYNSQPTLLLPSDEVDSAEESESVVTLVIYIPENVGNSLNPAEGAPTPQLKMGVRIIATQSTYEE